MVRGYFFINNMILRKRKFQRGGTTGYGLLPAPDIYYGRPPALDNVPLRGVAAMPRPYNYAGRNGSAATSALPKGGLQSDIEYYNAEKARIEARMKSIADENGIESPEYKAAAAEWYNLDKQVLPTLKTKESLYKQALSRLKTGKADGTPAYSESDGNILVTKLDDGSAQVITKYELLRNPTKYRMKTMGEAAIERAQNPSFSGYTEAGQFVDKLMSTVMGPDIFDNTVTDRIKNALGITVDKAGNKYTSNKTKLDFTNKSLKWDNSGVRVEEFSSPDLKNVVTGLAGLLTQTEKAFLEGQALQTLQSALIQEGEAYGNDVQAQDAIDQTKIGMLVKRLAGFGASKTSDGTTKTKKDIKLHPIQYAILNILGTTQGVEVTPEAATVGDEKDIRNIIYNTPSSTIGGADLITYATGEKERKSLGNSRFLSKATTSLQDATLANGVKLVDVIEGDGEASTKLVTRATIAPGSTVKVILAPIITKNGHRMVNFANDQALAVKRATKKALELIAKNKLTVDKLSTGTGPEIEEIKKEVNDMFNKELKGNEHSVKIGFALAFKVGFDANDGAAEKSPYIHEVGDDLSKMLKAILNIDSFEGTGATAWVFVPMDDTFRKSLYSSDSGKSYGMDPMDFSPEAFITSLHHTAITNENPSVEKTTVDMARSTNNTNQGRASQIKQEKDGGKLASADEIYDLLFK